MLEGDMCPECKVGRMELYTDMYVCNTCDHKSYDDEPFDLQVMSMNVLTSLHGMLIVDGVVSKDSKVDARGLVDAANKYIELKESGLL